MRAPTPMNILYKRAGPPSKNWIAQANIETQAANLHSQPLSLFKLRNFTSFKMFAPVTRLTAFFCVALSLFDIATAVGGIANGIEADYATSPVGKRHNGHRDDGWDNKSDPLRILRSGHYENFCRDLLHRPYYDKTSTKTSYSTYYKVKRVDVTKTDTRTRKTTTTTILEAATPTSSAKATTTVYTATEDVPIASTTITEDPETAYVTVTSTDILPSTAWETVSTTVTSASTVTVYKRHDNYRGIPYELRRYPTKSLSSACKKVIHPRTRVIKRTKVINKTVTKTNVKHAKATVTDTIVRSKTTTPPAVTETSTSSILTVSEVPVTKTFTETPEAVTVTATSTVISTDVTTSTRTVTSTVAPPPPAFSCASTQRSGRIASFYGVSGGVSYDNYPAQTADECCSSCFDTAGCVGWRFNYANACDRALKKTGGAPDGPKCPNGRGSVQSQVRNDDLSPGQAGNGPCGDIFFVSV
ncbi:hypothetical protein BJ508DRAFT_85639 [Ascobolus immersus RN42]|uniref:Uncharacterized protein n=1 Tax=Ascobolus immersus RN42 TaxID=1160509 RepID=A0A3N4HBD2_ASCIM|nr:hypothetical protein BJ508DRAFT_85639 [Ascobolus immersus RN42]